MQRRSDDLLRDRTMQSDRGGSPPAWRLGSWHLERAQPHHNRTAPDHRLHMPLGPPGAWKPLRSAGDLAAPRGRPLAIQHSYVARATRDLLDTTQDAPHHTRGAEYRPGSTPSSSSEVEGSSSYGIPGCFPYVSGGVFPISVSWCVSRMYRVCIHVYQSVSECIVGNPIHYDTA